VTEAPDLTGHLIDSRHKIVASIASDALGDVYEVSALRLGRSASIKLYRATKARSAATERFMSELGGFVNDATLGGRILDFGFFNDRPYIVFDPSGQVISPEDAIPKIRALVEALTVDPELSMSGLSMSGASLPDMTLDAELISSGPIGLSSKDVELEAKVGPPTPPPPSFPPAHVESSPPDPESSSPPIPVTDEPLEARAIPPSLPELTPAPPHDPLEETPPTVAVVLPPALPRPPSSPRKATPPPREPTPGSLAAKKKRLPKFDDIDVHPDPPFFDSGTIRVASELPVMRTRHPEPSFRQKHDGTIKGIIVAAYLLGAFAATFYFAHGLPNAARDARMLVRHGQTPQVIAQLEKYATSPNADPSLNAALGYAFVYAKKPHRALAAYRTAIERDPRVLEPADVAAISAFRRVKGEDGAEAEALMKKLEAAGLGLRADPAHGTPR
jgi:hypothetical protein